MRITKQFTNNFTQVPNYILLDKNVSLAAKGLYTYFISKPDNWQFSLNGLVSQLKESRPTIIKLISELNVRGYLKKIKNRKNGKQDINSYLIFDIPNLSANGSESKLLTQQNRVSSSDSKIFTTSNTISSNKILNNTLSKKQKGELSFKEFKEILEKTNLTFKTQGLGYLKEHKGFQIKNGYIFNLHSGKYLEKEEAYIIWDFLYQHKEEVLKNAN